MTDIEIGIEFEFVYTNTNIERPVMKFSEVKSINDLSMALELHPGQVQTLRKLYEEWFYDSAIVYSTKYLKEFSRDVGNDYAYDEAIQHFYENKIPKYQTQTFTEKDWLQKVGIEKVLVKLREQNNVNVDFYEQKLLKGSYETFMANYGTSVFNDCYKKFIDQVNLRGKHFYFNKLSSDKNSWNIKDDKTIKPEKGGFGVEITTPVWSTVDEAIENIRNVLIFISNNGYTNKTCGLHLNIGFTDKSKIDLYKFINDYGEENITKIFDRENSEHCKSLKPIIQKYLSEGNDDPSFVNDKIHDKSFSKYHTIRFKNEGSYYEFRNLGGKNYEYKFSDIEKTLENIIHFMKENKKAED